MSLRLLWSVTLFTNSTIRPVRVTRDSLHAWQWVRCFGRGRHAKFDVRSYVLIARFQLFKEKAYVICEFCEEYADILGELLQIRFLLLSDVSRRHSYIYGINDASKGMNWLNVPRHDLRLQRSFIKPNNSGRNSNRSSAQRKLFHG